MGFKITDYPVKSSFDDGDLMDFSSYDGVSAYTSEKLTLASLKTYLDSNLSYLSSVALNDLTDVTLTGAATGDILYKSAGDWVNLGAGSDGQVLTLASGVPSWAAAGGGGNSIYSADDNLAGNRTVSLSDGVSTDYNLTFASLTDANLIVFDSNLDKIGFNHTPLAGSDFMTIGGNTQIDGNITQTGTAGYNDFENEVHFQRHLSIGVTTPQADTSLYINGDSTFMMYLNSAFTTDSYYKNNGEWKQGSLQGSEIGIGFDRQAGVALVTQASTATNSVGLQVRDSGGTVKVSFGRESSVFDRFFMDLPTYADDTAAGVGGLTTGELYVETTSGNRNVCSKA